MTNKEALAYLIAAQSHTHRLSSGYKALERAIEALKIAVEAENKPVDARKDEGQVNIPLEEIRSEIGRIKDAMSDLETRVYILERKAKL